MTQGGNVTVSWLHYQPKAGHHHQTLICRGSNDDLMTATSRTVEDYHRMEIFCESNNNSKTSSATRTQGYKNRPIEQNYQGKYISR